MPETCFYAPLLYKNVKDHFFLSAIGTPHIHRISVATIIAGDMRFRGLKNSTIKLKRGGREKRYGVDYSHVTTLHLTVVLFGIILVFCFYVVAGSQWEPINRHWHSTYRSGVL